MNSILDSAKVDIPCPKCGRKIKESLGRLKNNPTLRCTCGTSIEINSTGKGGLAQGMKTVDKGVSNLQTVVRKLGK